MENEVNLEEPAKKTTFWNKIAVFVLMLAVAGMCKTMVRNTATQYKESPSLEQIVTEANKHLPKKIDSVTTLERNYIEGNSYVMKYAIDGTKELFDSTVGIINNGLENTICTNSLGKLILLKKRKQMVLRYYGQNNTLYGEIKVYPENCGVAGVPANGFSHKNFIEIAEQRKIERSRYSSTPSGSHQELLDLAARTLQGLPYKFDDMTTLVHVSADSTQFTYFYEVKIDKKKWAEVESSMEDYLLKEACGDSKNHLILVKHNQPIAYVYSDSKGKRLGEIKITPEDCKKLKLNSP